MKIIFTVVVMKGIGGIESSLLNLLKNLDPSKYSVDLCVMGNYTSPTTQIPEYVRIVKGNRILEYCCTEYSDLKRYLPPHRLAMAALVKGIKKITGLKPFLNLCLPFMKRQEHYDVAISYANDKYIGTYVGGCDDYIAKCIQADKKIAWIHNDARQHGLNHDICLKKYEPFDAVVNVSDECRRIFEEIIPEYREKSFTVTNMLSLPDIERRKQTESPYDASLFNIVTVARIENRQKRIDRVLECCRLLKMNGIKNVKWTVVGNGEDLKSMIQQAEEENLRDCLTFVGRKTNPVPYMQYADLFIQTSDYEAYSMVLIEALFVGCPIVCTNYDSASNIIQDGVNGWLVKKSSEEIYRKIVYLINNPSEILRIKANCTESCKALNIQALRSFETIIGVQHGKN